MHEESLIRTLLRQVEDVARQHSATEVDEVEIEIGPLSGAEPLLLESAFERLQPDTFCRHARLKVTSTALLVRCRTCHQDSQLPTLHFICPQCGSEALQILQGDAIRLINVSLQIPDSFSLADSPAASILSSNRSI